MSTYVLGHRFPRDTLEFPRFTGLMRLLGISIHMSFPVAHQSSTSDYSQIQQIWNLTILDVEWLRACAEARRFLGSQDDWAGFRVDSRYASSCLHASPRRGFSPRTLNHLPSDPFAISVLVIGLIQIVLRASARASKQPFR